MTLSSAFSIAGWFAAVFTVVVVLLALQSDGDAFIGFVIMAVIGGVATAALWFASGYFGRLQQVPSEEDYRRSKFDH